ncbi:MAG: NUDIX hydrolase [Sporolactobacillus sp.]
MGYIEELRSLLGHRPLLLPGAVVILIDKNGNILLQKRKFPKETWGLPGGLMELGESVEETAKREVLEETGLIVQKMKLFNVFSGKDTLATAANGDQYYPVTVVFTAHQYQGKLVVDPLESEDYSFIDLDRTTVKLLKNHERILKEWQLSRQGN